MKRLLLALLLLASVSQAAPTETVEAVGPWEIHCTVDEAMDRKTCILLALRPHTAVLEFAPAGGFSLYGVGNMRPTRAALRVDAEPGMESRDCDDDGCTFTRAQSIRLAALALKGRALLLILESPQANQRYEMDLAEFPAALAILRRENAGLPLLEPPPRRKSGA